MVKNFIKFYKEKWLILKISLNVCFKREYVSNNSRFNLVLSSPDAANFDGEGMLNFTDILGFIGHKLQLFLFCVTLLNCQNCLNLVLF